MAIELDLSVLHNIFANGSQGEELTSSASATTATPPPRIEAASLRSTAAATSKAAPFTDTTGTRDYKRLYRAALDFHTRNYPPRIDAAYWREHALGDAMPQAEEEYWAQVSDDMVVTLREAGESSDKFLIALLWAIADELTREYKRLIEEAASPATGGQEAASSLFMAGDAEEITQEAQRLGNEG